MSEEVAEVVVEAPVAEPTVLESVAPEATVDESAIEATLDSGSFTMEQLMELAKEDAGAKNLLGKFNEPQDFIKSMVEQQKFLGKRGDIPAEDASAEEKQAFFEKLGVPKEGADYEYDAPEGYELSEDMDAFLRETAKNSNMTKAQMKEFGSKLIERDAQLKASDTEAYEAKEQAGMEMLQDEWKDSSAEMIQAVKGILSKFDVSEEQANEIENSPETLILLGRIAKDLDEKGQIGTVFNSTRQGLSSELTDVESQLKEKLMANGNNVNDPALDALLSRRNEIKSKLD